MHLIDVEESMNHANHARPAQLTWGFVAVLVAAGAVHGPIAQLPDYHAFADQTVLMGIPHACDVLSNIPFALVALWGLAAVRGAAGPGRAGYLLFLVSLLLTAAGSAWYHLAPDNARLIWDRLPIALACAGLLAAVWGETRRVDAAPAAFLLSLGALASVAWWYFTDTAGQGDLRPYLLLQLAPMVLIPVWQWLARAPRADRLAFGGALALYGLAKLAELNDHEIAALAPLSGHTLKHLIAAGAAALIVARLAARNRSTHEDI